MTLFHYEHCPFCAKARMILGLKNVSFETKVLLNDDEKTPIDMIGVKSLPILQRDDGSFMGESLDIITYIDKNFGNGKIVSFKNPKYAISEWIDNSKNYANDLTMPRMIRMPLDEFKTQSAKDYYQNKREKNNIGSFDIALELSSKFIEAAEAELKKLETHIKPNGRFYDEALHIDDFHVFAALRNLSSVKGLVWPEKIMAYVKKMSVDSKVNLFFDLAV